MPQDLTVEEVTSTSMLVKWSSPEAVFSIHSVPEGKAEESEVVEDTQHRLTDLTPFTNYTVYVVAYHTKGASTQSQKVVQQTKDDGEFEFTFCSF